MRKLYAWLLLIISTVQWVGGHICFEVAHFVGVEVTMSEPEQAISNDILEETGIETSVKIIPKGQHIRVGADYGNYFAYTKTDSTGTVFYTIDYAPRTVTWDQVAGDAPKKHSDAASKTNLLKLLFSEFLFPVEEFPKDNGPDLVSVNFWLINKKTDSLLSTLTPPPDSNFIG